MNWGRLDDPAWWWEYALDGVIGGVIGGLVTALAVWLTLRHGRKLARETGDRELRAVELTAARAQVLALQGAMWRVHQDVRSETDPMPNLLATREICVAMASSLMRWPGAHGRIIKAYFKFDAAVVAAAVDLGADGKVTGATQKRLNGTGRRLMKRTRGWQRDPDMFEDSVMPTPADEQPHRLRARLRALGRQRDS